MTRREITPERIEQLRREHARYIQDRRQRGIPRDGLRPNRRRYLATWTTRQGRKRSEIEIATIRRLREFAHRRHIPIDHQIIGIWDGDTYTAYIPQPPKRSTNHG